MEAIGLLQELGEEVVSQVLELLEGHPSATAWHGACLTLAECARRRSLSQQQLQDIAPSVAKALHLDICRGAHRCDQSVKSFGCCKCKQKQSDCIRICFSLCRLDGVNLISRAAVQWVH